MNYISGALRYVAGAEADSKNAIPRLVDRIKTSALPQDRRSAISSLTEAAKVSPQRQVLVGELTLKVLYAVLEQDKEYDDTLKAALELLIAICGTLDPPRSSELLVVLGEAGEGLSDQDRLRIFEDRTAQAAATNVDVFLGLPNAVLLLLDLLEKADFYVKFGTIELLTAMAANSRHTLQMAVLEAPQGVSRICDLLDDNHRHVRSNAVLLLSTLCDESPEICKIIAYGGVLEKLFALIETVTGDSGNVVDGEDQDDDESLEAAIVVQDVLLVLRNLINGASTTKTFFRDTGCLPRLVNVVKRSAEDAGMLAQENSQPGQSKPGVGMKVAVEKQARKNLVVAMHCISGLVREEDNESRLVKNAFTSTNLFNLLAGLAFATQLTTAKDGSKQPEHMLQVRIGAMRTMASLARGHDEFRAMFTASSPSVLVYGEAANAQIASMRIMSKDPSAAARAAAYAALRESFVVDAALDLPSSSLLNAMTTSTGSAYGVNEGRTRMRRNPRSTSSELSSSSTPVQLIAETLKASLVGWPSDSDSAGAFYAASLVTWVVDKVQGARERLLASYVNGSSLLPQVIRVLGKLEREKGPPEVRVALFSLTCAWLYNSPSAVSAFLSSAMHLPMLVEVLNRSGSRGDVAEVHVRGLAAVLIGICLQASETSSDTASDGGFISGAGGASAVIPRQTLVDVIRNRVGLTEFTACLDDLRASKAFSDGTSHQTMWDLVEHLVSTEERSGFLSANGSLGHEIWYSPSVVTVVTDVYKNVGARALDLISDQHSGPSTAGNGLPSTTMMNGHAPHAAEDSPSNQALLADSARDEVLNSYKEFIRSQDESLSAARRQIEELSTALRETQMELDVKASEVSAAKESETIRSVKESNAELVAQKEALEALLEEKAADFAALSDAYAALEEEHSNETAANDAGRNTVLGTELSELRTMNSHLRGTLGTEKSRNAELARQVALLENVNKVNEAQLEAISRERDQLKVNVRPEVSDAFQWRTRAEVAEASIASHRSLLNSVQETNGALEQKIQNLEHLRDENSLSVAMLERKLEAATLELEEIKETRKRELQVSRESSQAANAAAQQQIAELRRQLSEALERPTAAAENHLNVSAQEREKVEALQRDHEALSVSFEQLKTELVDTKNALTQWQRKGEAGEAAKERETLENARLSNLVRNLEEQVRSMKESLTSQSQASSAAATRVAELERQTAELDEMRLRSEEETKALKEELAARTEQSIRLSGQLYEAEDANMKMEEELQRLRNEVLRQTEGLELEKQKSLTAARETAEANVTEQAAKLAVLQEELEATKEALADSRDRESLGQAHARERDTAVQRAASLEQSLKEALAREGGLQNEVSRLGERLLSLNEAEEAKRALTMQVVSLQRSLDEAKALQETTNSLASSTVHEQNAKYEEEIKEMRTQAVETEVQLNALRASLDGAANRANMFEKEKMDLAKQVAETEAMFSVLNSERDDLVSECETLRQELEERPKHEISPTAFEELQADLERSEEKRAAISSELASLIEACRVSEQEIMEIRNSNDVLQQKLITADAEMKQMQETIDDRALSEEVDKFVTSVIRESAVNATSHVSDDELYVMRTERDAAILREAEGVAVARELRTQMASLEATLRSRDEKLIEYSQYREEVSVLGAKLARLQSVAEERNGLAKSLQEARTALHELEEQKATILQSLNERDNTHDRDSLHTKSPDRVEAVGRRTKELEDALRDAAKTVAATNLELLAAQALLVELSADKTAIRSELRAAQEEIQSLNARLSINAKAVSADPALSEVSELDHSASEAPTDSPIDAAVRELTEQRIKTANAEAENLRTALQRTISEADSANSVIVQIQNMLELLEDKLVSSQTSVRDFEKLEQELRDDISVLKSSHEVEKASLLKSISSLKTEVDIASEDRNKVKQELAEELKILEEAKLAQEAQLQAKVEQKEDKIKIMESKCSSIQAELDECNKKVKSMSEKAISLEDSNFKYASTIRTLEGTIESVNKSLADSRSRENSLEASVQNSHEELLKNKSDFARERRELEDVRKKEAEEFEAEIDRASQALEEAERKFRDTEVALKEKVKNLESLLTTTTEELRTTKETLKSQEASLTRATTEKGNLEGTLRDTVRQNEATVAALIAQKTTAEARINTLMYEKKGLQEELTKANTDLEDTKCALSEECERRSMLEGENQDFLNTIQTLESSSKRLRAELNSKGNDLEACEKELEASQAALDKKSQEAVGLEGRLRTAEDDIKQLKVVRARLEDEADKLREDLDVVEAAKDAAEQDNSDLKAWVSDLERQATELQSAAENFEDVEQSLREALETQRDVLEQNTTLAEELKKEKEALGLAEANLRSAIRAQTAAEAARDSAQKKSSDLEGRIREIREEHLAKVSNSEDAIRAKAQRCAELETELASAERKLAELASVSDTLFGAKAELRQRDEEIRALKTRAEAGEKRAEELQVQLQALEIEVSEMRESGSGEAYRVLAADHNELLICLADMELENQSLKEELGRE